MSYTKVTVSELQNAAARFTQNNQAMRDAAAELKSAADALADTWEGEAHDSFVSEQEQINKWYEQMFQTVDEFVTTINQAASEYDLADQQGAQIIRRS